MTRLLAKESGSHSTEMFVEKWHPDTVVWALNKIHRLYNDLPNGWEPKGAQLGKLVKPDDVFYDGTPNLITTAGLGRQTNFLIGTGSLVGFTATTVRMGVGNASTAATAADTDLGASAGSSNRWFQIVDGAPTRTTVTVTNDTINCVATFGVNDGNFTQSEWCLNLGTATPTSSATVDASGGACFYNHKISALGQKVTNAIWTHTARLTFS
jgi:hypothetical protein